MITTAVFPFLLPKVSSRYSEGKRYTLASNPVAGSSAPLKLYWYYNQNDQTGHAEIQEGSQVRYSYEEGDPLPREMPDGLKQRIVDDYNALLGKTEEEKEEEQKETTTTVRTETVRGITITMKRTENTFDMRGGEDATYYQVMSSDGTKSPFLDTQEEAEETFQRYVNNANQNVNVGWTEEYRGVQIKFQDLNHKDGEDYINPLTGESADVIQLTGAVVEDYKQGDQVVLIDAYGTQDFGTITYNKEADLEVLKAYIDAVLDPRPDPRPPVEEVVEVGELPIMSWGYYDSTEGLLNPFSKVYLENVFTVSGTDGRILVLQDDDFIAQGFESGLARLVVKQGYRVELKVMVQEKGYLEDYLPNTSKYGFETYGEADDTDQATNYIDTEKVSIMLNGGDSLDINIDGLDIDPKVDNFKIIQNGKVITRGGAPKINRETFLAITYVEKLEEPQGGGGGDGEGGEEVSTSTGNVLALVIGGGLILTILYMILARGDEE